MDWHEKIINKIKYLRSLFRPFDEKQTSTKFPSESNFCEIRAERRRRKKEIKKKKEKKEKTRRRRRKKNSHFRAQSILPEAEELPQSTSRLSIFFHGFSGGSVSRRHFKEPRPSCFQGFTSEPFIHLQQFSFIHLNFLRNWSICTLKFAILLMFSSIWLIFLLIGASQSTTTGGESSGPLVRPGALRTQ